MIGLLNEMIIDAYAKARAEIERAGRRIETVSARLEPDPRLDVDATRVVFMFDTAPATIRPATDLELDMAAEVANPDADHETFRALQESADRRSR